MCIYNEYGGRYEKKGYGKSVSLGTKNAYSRDKECTFDECVSEGIKERVTEKV